MSRVLINTMKSSDNSNTSNIAPVRKLKRGRGRPSTKQPTGDELRELIIAAATQDYAQRGYHGSSVAQILSISGISRPTFYRYFKNRREVLDTILARLNDLLLEIAEEMTVEEDSLRGVVASSVDAYFVWGKRIGPLVGPIYREINDPESPASVHRQRIVGELAELFKIRVESVGGASLDPLLYEALLHMVEHIGHKAFWPAQQPDAEIARRRAVIFRVLIASLAMPQDDSDLHKKGRDTPAS